MLSATQCQKINPHNVMAVC